MFHLLNIFYLFKLWSTFNAILFNSTKHIKSSKGNIVFYFSFGNYIENTFKGDKICIFIYLFKLNGKSTLNFNWNKYWREKQIWKKKHFTFKMNKRGRKINNKWIAGNNILTFNSTQYKMKAKKITLIRWKQRMMVLSFILHSIVSKLNLKILYAAMEIKVKTKKN